MTGITPEQKLLDVIKRAQGKLRLKKDLKIFTKVNIALIALIAVILAVFLKDMLFFKYDIPELNIKLPLQEDQVLPLRADSKGKTDEDNTDFRKKRPSVSKESLIKNLALLGIVRGEKDQAIIEDKDANKTFFLYEGDTIKRFKVYDIKDSKVILDYKGERIELNI